MYFIWGFQSKQNSNMRLFSFVMQYNRLKWNNLWVSLNQVHDNKKLNAESVLISTLWSTSFPDLTFKKLVYLTPNHQWSKSRVTTVQYKCMSNPTLSARRKSKIGGDFLLSFKIVINYTLCVSCKCHSFMNYISGDWNMLFPLKLKSTF